MLENIFVGLASFFVIGTALALALCGAARGAKAPLPMSAGSTAEDRTPVAQAS